MLWQVYILSLRTPPGLIAIPADRSSCSKVGCPRQPLVLLGDWCPLRSFILREAPMIYVDIYFLLSKHF